MKWFGVLSVLMLSLSTFVIASPLEPIPTVQPTDSNPSGVPYGNDAFGDPAQGTLDNPLRPIPTVKPFQGTGRVSRGVSCDDLYDLDMPLPPSCRKMSKSKVKGAASEGTGVKLFRLWREKCSRVSGADLEKCMQELRKTLSKVAKLPLPVPLQKAGKVINENKAVYVAVAGQYTDHAIGTAAGKLLSDEELRKMIYYENLHVKYCDLFTEHAVSEHSQSQMPSWIKLSLKVCEPAKEVVVSKLIVLPLLFAELPGDSMLMKRARELVGNQRVLTGRQFADAKKNFQAAWADLRDFKGSDKAEKNRKLGKAIEAVCDARVKAAHKLASQGADAQEVEELLSFMQNECEKVASASFEQRREILRSINGEWNEFAKETSSVLMLEKMEAGVVKLKATLVNAGEAIGALEQHGAKPEHVDILRKAAGEAEVAVSVVFHPSEESLRLKMRKFLEARSKVSKLAKLINAVRNRLAVETIQEEPIQEAVIASVPDVVPTPFSLPESA